MAKYDLINDIDLDDLEAWQTSGDGENMPEELVMYLELLDIIRSWHVKYVSRDEVINRLICKPYELSRYKSQSLYSDAINYFYLDNEIRAEAWCNVYADKLEKAAQIVLMTAKSSKDLDLYKNIILAARDTRLKAVPEDNGIPEEVLNKPFKIYTLDPAKVGLQVADRNKLAQQIDSWDIDEVHKERIKEDAGLKDVNLRRDE